MHYLIQTAYVSHNTTKNEKKAMSEDRCLESLLSRLSQAYNSQPIGYISETQKQCSLDPLLPQNPNTKSYMLHRLAIVVKIFIYAFSPVFIKKLNIYDITKTIHYDDVKFSESQ